MKRLLISFACAASLFGCYEVEEPSVRKLEPWQRGNGAHLDQREECRATHKSACLAGQVVAAPVIRLEGKEFFDADDLGRRFKEMVEVRNDKGESLTLSDYDMSVFPEITNESFIRGFQVYAKGQKVVAKRVNDRGFFRIDYLTPGEYDVRVQKRFQLKLTPKGASTETRSLERTYCFVIYAEENGIDFMRGEKVYKGLDEFNLQMLDSACKNEAQGAVITL